MSPKPLQCRLCLAFCITVLLFGTIILNKKMIYYNNLYQEKVRHIWTFFEKQNQDMVNVSVSLEGDGLNQNEENVCNIPKLDPFDPLIMKYVKHPKPFTCIKEQPFLTFIDDDGCLRYNDTELKVLQNDNISFKCVYQTFDRKFGKRDNYEEYDKEITLENPVQLEKDAVIVRCNSPDDKGNWSYYNFHAHPAITVDRLFAEPTNDQLSVLIFLIDSVSYSALQRNLPLTYKYTKNVMGMKYFTKLNKIGSNSFPNQMAYLTGKRVRDEQGDMPKELPENTPLNTWPFIWKQFSAKSYATAINEDSPRGSIFNYLVKGFTKKKVDYYYHNFWRVAYNGSKDCFANVPYIKISTDITRRHLKTFKDKLQFVYSSITHGTHESDNEVEQIELYIMEFWKEMHEGNYLNNTVVLFLSDHGLRLGNIRKTLEGLLEERLPFYGIWFPPWFYSKYPNIEKNIDNNLDRLTTPFDVYETLKDIVDANYDGTQRQPKSRGHSQLFPLPLNRTCKMAGIANHWCTCIQEIPTDTNQTVAFESAKFIVDHLNSLLKNVSDICQKINFSQVKYINQIIINKKLKDGEKGYIELESLDNKTLAELEANYKKHHVETYVIGLETVPFNATFEATVVVNSTNNRNIWSLNGEIARTNLYAGLSDCIQDKFLRQYCPCFNGTVL